jgi:hypothetical protein
VYCFCRVLAAAPGALLPLLPLVLQVEESAQDGRPPLPCLCIVLLAFLAKAPSPCPIPFIAAVSLYSVLSALQLKYATGCPLQLRSMNSAQPPPLRCSAANRNLPDRIVWPIADSRLW